MAVSALAERRGQQAYRARMPRSADAIEVSFISVAVFRSCKFPEIFAVHGSYYVAKGRHLYDSPLFFFTCVKSKVQLDRLKSPVQV